MSNFLEQFQEDIDWMMANSIYEFKENPNHYLQFRRKQVIENMMKAKNHLKALGFGEKPFANDV